MKRLLVFACAAALLAGCVPEDLSSLLPTVQSGSLGKDVFLFEDAIVSNDVVEGDLFAWGTTVEINGQVDGSIYVYGREVMLNAPVGGSVTVIGREIELTESAHVGQGLLFAGVLLQMKEGASVGGGVTAAGYQVLLDGSIGEYVRGAMLRLRLDGTVGSSPAGRLAMTDDGEHVRPTIIPAQPIHSRPRLAIRSVTDSHARITRACCSFTSP